MNKKGAIGSQKKRREVSPEEFQALITELRTMVHEKCMPLPDEPEYCTSEDTVNTLRSKMVPLRSMSIRSHAGFAPDWADSVREMFDMRDVTDTSSKSKQPLETEAFLNKYPGYQLAFADFSFSFAHPDRLTLLSGLHLAPRTTSFWRPTAAETAKWKFVAQSKQAARQSAEATGSGAITASRPVKLATGVTDYLSCADSRNTLSQAVLPTGSFTQDGGVGDHVSNQSKDMVRPAPRAAARKAADTLEVRKRFSKDQVAENLDQLRGLPRE
ncbi:unnamed protein product [Echinostoma caproni]|uniref:DBR1 domain-containing protein n=1 Tax=Echinostoma caproni TaxID=27848 RepID=A0A183A9Z6_9TREM|nr:unnamed protein product [Echinostoma caproni]